MAVIVGGGGVAGRLGRGDKRVVKRVVARPARDVKRPAGAAPGRLAAMRCFHPAEIGKNVGVSPAGGAGLLPVGIIPGMATDIDHAVDRRGAANHLAAGAGKRTPAKRRLRFCPVAPVIARHVHRIGQRGRHLDQRPGIGSAKFQYQDPTFAVLAKPIGEGASRGT